MYKKLKVSLGISIVVLGISIGISVIWINHQKKILKENISETVSLVETEKITTEEEPTELVTEETEIVELTYAQQVGLPYVAKPQKRNHNQVMEALETLAKDDSRIAEIYANASSYSNEMLANLVNNPEMTDYFYGILDSDGSVTGGITELEKSMDFPLLLQYDPRWGYYVYGDNKMAFSGCGPTCLSMAALHFAEDKNLAATPDEVALYSMQNGHYVSGVGSAWSLMSQYPTSIGLTSYNIWINEDEMEKELDAGRVLICSMSPGDFTSGGHFIMFYGYDEEGFMVNDPKCVYRSNLKWSYDTISSQIKKIWSIGK